MEVARVRKFRKFDYIITFASLYRRPESYEVRPTCRLVVRGWIVRRLDGEVNEGSVASSQVRLDMWVTVDLDR